MDFGGTLAQDPASGPMMRLGVVTQASPLLVRVGAASTAVRASALGSYAARVDDVVVLLEQGADRVVLGPAHAGDRVARVFATVAAAQTGISAMTDLTGLSVSFTSTANRLYRVSFQLRLAQIGSAGLVTAIIADGSNAQHAAWQGSIAAGDRLSAHLAYLVAPGAGAQTYKVRLSTSAGTVDSLAVSASPAMLLVEDIGPA